MNLVCLPLILVILPLINGQRGAPPGVNPQHYQNTNYQNNQHYQQPPQPGQQYGNAPGVPPNQYQQQQHHTGHVANQPNQYQPSAQPQYQAPPQQQQYQAPPQQQQVPHQPQQVPHQPQLPHQPQHQGQPDPVESHAQMRGHQQRVLHKNNIKEESAHIKEHLDIPLDTSGMSEDELQFHYFKLHDVDNNNKLDGQELIKSLFHWHDSSNHDATKNTGHPPPENKIFSDEDLINMIDPILQQDDMNKDGFVDYPEFVRAQRNAGASATQGDT